VNYWGTICNYSGPDRPDLEDDAHKHIKKCSNYADYVIIPILLLSIAFCFIQITENLFPYPTWMILETGGDETNYAISYNFYMITLYSILIYSSLHAMNLTYGSVPNPKTIPADASAFGTFAKIAAFKFQSALKVIPLIFGTSTTIITLVLIFPIEPTNFYLIFFGFLLFRVVSVYIVYCRYATKRKALYQMIDQFAILELYRSKNCGTIIISNEEISKMEMMLVDLPQLLVVFELLNTETLNASVLISFIIKLGSNVYQLTRDSNIIDGIVFAIQEDVYVNRNTQSVTMIPMRPIDTTLSLSTTPNVNDVQPDHKVDSDDGNDNVNAHALNVAGTEIELYNISPSNANDLQPDHKADFDDGNDNVNAHDLLNVAGNDLDVYNISPSNAHDHTPEVSPDYTPEIVTEEHDPNFGKEDDKSDTIQNGRSSILPGGDDSTYPISTVDGTPRSEYLLIQKSTDWEKSCRKKFRPAEGLSSAVFLLCLNHLWFLVLPGLYVFFTTLFAYFILPLDRASSRRHLNVGGYKCFDPKRIFSSMIWSLQIPHLQFGDFENWRCEHASMKKALSNIESSAKRFKQCIYSASWEDHADGLAWELKMNEEYERWNISFQTEYFEAKYGVRIAQFLDKRRVIFTMTTLRSIVYLGVLIPVSIITWTKYRNGDTGLLLYSITFSFGIFTCCILIFLSYYITKTVDESEFPLLNLLHRFIENDHKTKEDTENVILADGGLRDFDHKGETPLTKCARLKNFGRTYAKAQLLVEYQAPVNDPNLQGHTPLNVAIDFQNRDMINLLINHPDIDLNRENDKDGGFGEYPLYSCSFRCDFRTAKQLIDKGANIRQKGKYGGYIHNILNSQEKVKKRVEYIKNLLGYLKKEFQLKKNDWYDIIDVEMNMDAHANEKFEILGEVEDIKLKNSTITFDGGSNKPFGFQVSKDGGVIKVEEGSQAADSGVEAGWKILNVDGEDFSLEALMDCIEMYKEDKEKFEITFEIEFNHIHYDGDKMVTELWQTLELTTDENKDDYYEIVKELLDCGADPNHKCLPLFKAMTRCEKETINLLLDANANVQIKNNDGISFLQTLCELKDWPSKNGKFKEVELVQLLLEKCPEEFNKEDETLGGMTMFDYIVDGSTKASEEMKAVLKEGKVKYLETKRGAEEKVTKRDAERSQEKKPMASRPVEENFGRRQPTQVGGGNITRLGNQGGTSI